MKIPWDLLCLTHYNIIGEQAISTAYQCWQGNPCGCIKMDDLTKGMHTSIGAPSRVQTDRPIRQAC